MKKLWIVFVGIFVCSFGVQFLQTDLMQTLRWIRMIGDTVFAVGAISFVYFALDLILRQRGARVAVRTEVVAETV